MKKKLLYDNIIPKKSLTEKSRSLIFFEETSLLHSGRSSIALERGKNRLFFIFFSVITLFIFVIFNLFELSIVESKGQSLIKNKTYNENPIRGKIIDRNGRIISASIPTLDLYLDGKKIIDKELTINKLVELFPEKNFDFFNNIILKKNYKLVSRHLSEDEEYEIKKLGEPGLLFHKSTRRVYPHDNLFSHVTGFVSKFGNAQSKLEKNYNHQLKAGKDLQLTLDLKIQNIVYEEIKKSKNFFESKGSLGLLLNVNNGEIISMVSRPDFNPNHPKTIKPFTENSLVTSARFEMGSILKLYNAAMAYENKTINQGQLFDVSNDYNLTKTYRVQDTIKFNKSINFDEVFTYSSNVGSIKIFETIGTKLQQDFLFDIGLNDQVMLDGLTTVNNLLPEKQNWNDVIGKSISYGYALSITPISLATSFSSLVNGGFKINPKIIKTKEFERNKIITSETSSKINKLLYKVVQIGTGQKAKVDGISIGGKTSTAKKSNGFGGYFEKKVLTSFLGVFPIEKPEFLLLVLFDEPEKGINSPIPYSSNTAAPIFANIVKKISPMLGVKSKKFISDKKFQLTRELTNQ